MEDSKKSMFKNAMDENWEEVVEACKDNPTAQEAKITRSGETALHVAIYSRRKDTAIELVDLIAHQDLERILGIKNDRGNIALHLAATLGMEEMCLYIAGKVPKLIESRNNEGESPLFLAALHGKKKTFMSLHSKCLNGNDISLCRRTDGNTILHCAISGEYFDLAFIIIRKYPLLINYHNEKGQSALHLMASHPSFFSSGCPLGTLDTIIYHCIAIDGLEEEILSNDTHLLDFDRNSKCPLPENYTVCRNFFTLLWKLGDIVVVAFLHLVAMCKRESKNAKSYFTEGNKSVHGIGKDVEQHGHDNHRHSHPEPQPSRSVGRGERRNHLGSHGGIGNHTTLPCSSSKPVEVLPPNYDTCFRMFKLAMKMLLILLGLGYWRITEIIDKKQKHTWAFQIMEELVSHASSWEYDNTGRNPQHEISRGINLLAAPEIDENPPHTSQRPGWKENEGLSLGGTETAAKNGKGGGMRETPILLAAKMGVTEVVEKILKIFPVSIQDMNDEEKNIVLLAVENRQPHVYQLLLKKKLLLETVFNKVDRQGNSALHLAAMLTQNRPWLIPGAALQMQWEIKWYKFVQDSMPRHFFAHDNNNGETPTEIFTKTHENLVKEGGGWLTNTSQSCSVVAALIATVAFATATTVPGGVKEENGSPTLEGKPVFEVFAISSLIALCLSVTSLIMFLAILTSRYQEKDFARDLPVKLIIGLTCLFLSIASMMVSFCAGHFFVLEEKLKYAAYPVYTLTCLPATFFALAQFPLYIDLLRSIIKRVPQRTYKILSF